MTLAEDGVFMSSMAVLLISAYKFTVKYCYNSKCEDFSCFWGILRIRRNIQAEVDLDTQQRAADAQQARGSQQQQDADMHAIEDEDDNFEFRLDRNAQFAGGGFAMSGAGRARGGSAASLPVDDDDIV
jgi:hypothetical protein